MSECKDGFNCRFCMIPLTGAEHEVQHTWDHRQAGHMPIKDIGCPNCLKVGEVKAVYSAQYEPNNLHYRCQCGHLFDSMGRVQGPLLRDVKPEDMKPGAFIMVDSPAAPVVNLPERGPGVKLDFAKDDLWMHLFDNFPLAMGWLAEHMKAGDNEPGHVHHGWRTVPDGYNRYSAALLRHMMAEKVSGEVSYLDKCDMAISVLANAFIRAEILLRMDVGCGEEKK